MSQVRKLLKGNLVPKAQQGYKFKLDSQEYNVTEDQLKEIDNQIALLDPQHRRFLGNWTNAIKSGNSSGNRASNTVTINMISGVDGKDIDRLKKQKGSFWESFAPKDSYYAKEAINQALTITASVLANAPANKSEEPSKTKIEKSSIDLDFNEKDGKKYLSPTSEQNMSARKRVSDLLAHLQAGNNSTYDYSAYNTDAISSWLNGLEGDDKYKAGNDYFNNLWTAMGNSNYAYDPDVDDLLKMFGINYNMASPSSGTTSDTGAISGSNATTGAGTGSVTDTNTGIDKDIVNDIEESEQASASMNANLPTLITPELAKSMNLGKEYLFGIIDIDGEKYTPEQIKTNRSLSELMQYVESVNKQNMPQSERYKLISEKLNIPTIENYTDWLPGMTVKGIDLDSIFKSKNVSSAAISKQNLEGFDDYTVLKYFNNGEVGTNPWGFRSPYYLVIGKDGKLHVQTNEPHIEAIYGSKPTTDGSPTLVESNWNPEDVFVDKWTGATNWSDNWGGISAPSTQRKLRLSEIGKVVLPFNNVTQRIMRDINDVWYAVGSDGKTRKINKEYAKKILQGSGITRSEWHNNISNSYKQGGTISKSKVDSFKSKFGNVVKGQDGLLTPKIVISSDSSAAPLKLKSSSASKPLTKRVDELGRILVEDGNGNMLIIDNKQEPIPNEVANSVERPIDPNQKTIDDFTEAASKPGPAVVQPPFYIKNPPIQYPTDPEVFSTRIGNVEENKPIIVPQVPLTEQKTIPVKTKERRSFSDLVDVLKQLVDKKQSGGIMKMKKGDPLDNWSINLKEQTGKPTTIAIKNNSSDPSNSLNGTVNQNDASFNFWSSLISNNNIPTEWNQLESEWNAYKKRSLPVVSVPTTTVTINGKPQTIIQKPVGMRLESGLKNPSAYTASNNDGIRRTSSIVSSDEEYDEIGGYPMNIQDRSKHLIPLISLVRFGINAGLQRKYRDTAKKAIEAGRFNEQPAVLNTPRNDNPALDRALQQIQSERMAGVKPVTSDLIANNAILNQREAQLWDREQNVIRQRSQADWEAKKEALNIMNQNIVNQTTTANSNRARNAAINSALYNPELEFIQRRGQSIENLGLEIQNNIKQDRNVILNHQRDLELQKETNILNNRLDAMFPGGRKAYDLLSDDEKLNYTDYADFLRKKYPEKWNANVDTINRLQSAYANNVRAWMYENGLNYSYPTFLTGRQSTIGYKKGGYLKGSTRYTMEPDERIWVDNNKATHAAISKLSESTIKLLLRALK